MNNVFKEFLREQIDALSDIEIEDIVHVSELIKQVADGGNRIWTAGNGGSATSAAHFATDLSKGCYIDPIRQYPAICLNEQMGTYTAWSNDYSFADAIANILDSHAKPGDCFIGISGSGDSENMVNALIRANKINLITVAFLGMGGGKCKGLSAKEIIVSSNDMQIVENSHLYLIHAIYKYLSR